MRDSIPLLASALAFALTPSLFAQQEWFNTWNSPGGSTGDAFGYSVAEMGDLDSDGLSEVLVGAIGADNNGRNSGSVFILDGDTGNVLLRVDGEGAGDLLGVDVIGLDDLDGDGSKDFAAGSPYYEGANGFFSGRAYVFSGADGSVLDTIEGLAAGDMLGSALAFGDIDGDGIKELMVSAIGHGNMDGDVRAFNFNQTTGALEEDVPLSDMLVGSTNSEWFGFALDCPGSISPLLGDGLVVGAPFDSTTGSASLFAVHPGNAGSGLLSKFNFLPTLAGPPVKGVGISVSALKGDSGAIYLAAGAPINHGGSVFVWDVSLGFPNTHRIDGVNLGAHFGFSVALLDDSNFDGEPDLAIGEPGNSHIEVLDLANPTAPLLVLDGTLGARMGWSMTRLSDSNGSGKSDFVASGTRISTGAGTSTGAISHWTPPDTDLDPPATTVTSTWLLGDDVTITVDNLRDPCDLYFYAGKSITPTTSAEGFDLDIGNFQQFSTPTGGDYFFLASNVTGGTKTITVPIPLTMSAGSPLIFQVGTKTSSPFLRVSPLDPDDGGLLVAPPFQLDYSPPPAAGATTNLQANFGHPNEKIYFFYGTSTGSAGYLGFIVNTGLSAPTMIANIVADATGTANSSIGIPAGTTGFPLYFSAVSWINLNELLDVTEELTIG